MLLRAGTSHSLNSTSLSGLGILSMGVRSIGRLSTRPTSFLSPTGSGNPARVASRSTASDNEMPFSNHHKIENVTVFAGRKSNQAIF
jgi:hypothetical protein